VREATLAAIAVSNHSMTKSPADLLYGTLNVLVLKTLSWKPMHGYAISNWLRERSTGTLEIDDAAMYKALHRLEELGAIGSVWGMSENNRRAKYYHLTAAGRRLLRDERAAWQAYALVVSRILRTT
jgi:PadR family transcriptional regulator PadR